MWQFYKDYYKEFKFNGIEQKIAEDFISEKYRIKFELVENSDLEFAGDCSFNFNDKKVEKFIKIIDKDSKIDNTRKDELKLMLNECRLMHHTLLNFDLMLVTGAMNNVKGCIKHDEGKLIVLGSGHDRLDSFITLLNDAFIKMKEKHIGSLREVGQFYSDSVFTKSLASAYFTKLYDFLATFENIYEYCATFYKMDKEMTDKMIESGKKPIETAEDLENYMILAQDYWSTKEKKILKEMGHGR